MMNQMLEHGDKAFSHMPKAAVSPIRRKGLDIAYAHSSSTFWSAPVTVIRSSSPRRI